MVSDKQKVGLSISLCFCTFCAVFLCLVSAGNYSTARHPPFEPNAREGTPSIAADANIGYSPVCHKDISWSAHIGDRFAPKTEDGQLYADVYFANDNSNVDYLMIQAIDENKSILGETGLLKPNQYVKRLFLRSCPAKGEPVRIQIISYQPEIYRNNGNIILHMIVF